MAILLRWWVRVFCLSLLLTSCKQGVLTRPYGYLRVGKAAELRGHETYLPDLRLLLRHDQGGFSVMSTDCTYDLSSLTPVRGADGEKFVSSFSTSEYAKDGRVLNGPATANLPYYKLELQPGEIGGPRDTLYAVIGSEVPSDWRLRE